MYLNSRVLAKLVQGPGFDSQELQNKEPYTNTQPGAEARELSKVQQGGRQYHCHHHYLSQFSLVLWLASKMDQGDVV